MMQKLSRLLMIPYLLGIAWHLAHPFASIFTGDFDRPRGRYIDENSLEPSMLPNPEPIRKVKSDRLLTKLCAGLQELPWVPCRTVDASYQVATIQPVQSAVAPSESMVFVVPWDSQHAFTAYFLSLLHRLASDTPWLAKTLVVVAPLDPTTNLSDVVETYLHNDASSTLLRQLWVVEHHDGDDVRLLPAGARGLLPNMDLVWVTQAVLARYCRTQKLSAMHPYPLTNPQIHQYAPLSWRQPLRSLWQLLAFEYSLLSASFGASPPHAPALSRGIDSLTLGANLEAASAWELVTALESLTRATGQLHERLHHSTRLYLLPSTTTFVKHEEYLVPNLLLLIPCVLRNLVLGLDEMEGVKWRAVGRCLGVVVGMTMWRILQEQWLSLDESSWLRRLSPALPLVAAHVFATRPLLRSDTTTTVLVHTLQFFGCLLCLYTHIPIAFGHVSLAFPSALLWTPVFLYRGKWWSLLVLAYSTIVWFGTAWLWQDTATPYILGVAQPLVAWGHILHATSFWRQITTYRKN